MADLDDVAARIGSRFDTGATGRDMMALAAGLVILGTVGGFAVGRVTRGTTHWSRSRVSGNAAGATLHHNHRHRHRRSRTTGSQWSRLFVRTARDGIVMRVFLDPNVSPATSTSKCHRTMQSARRRWPRAATTARPIISTGDGMFGTARGCARRVGIVHVGQDVARVRARSGTEATKWNR